MKEDVIAVLIRLNQTIQGSTGPFANSITRVGTSQNNRLAMRLEWTLLRKGRRRTIRFVVFESQSLSQISK